MTARYPDGWNWDGISGTEGAWLYFKDGRYCAWVEPKVGLFVAAWRRADGTWTYPWGEDPAHHFTNPYHAMLAAEAKV